MKTVFVTTKEKIEDLDNREIRVDGKLFDSTRNHIDDRFRATYNLNGSNLKKVYREIAEHLHDLNGVDKVIFDARVLYNRDDTEGDWENTHTEKIRQEFNRL